MVRGGTRRKHMSNKQLEAAKNATAKALALQAAIASPATNPKAAEGDPATDPATPAEGGGDDIMKRMDDLEAKCGDLEERVKALEGAGAESQEAAGETAKALQAVTGLLNKFEAQFKNPALARIGAAAAPSASGEAPNETAKTLHDQWMAMPAGKAKDEFLLANAHAINATAK
jgi:hypothetical protein